MIALPDDAFAALSKSIGELETTFISPSLTTKSLAALTDTERLHLSAYVVLSHAAFEEYFELLAIWALDTTVARWAGSTASQATVALILHSGKTYPIGDIDKSPEAAFDRVRIELDRLKSPLSSYIMKENHGISMKYLKKMFYPLGIDIPSDLRLRASLATLADLRGDVAHAATKGATKHRDPAETKIIVEDCLDLALEMKKRVAAI